MFSVWHLRIITFHTVISFVMISFFLLFCIPIQFVGAPSFVRNTISKIFAYIYIYSMWFICGIKFKIEGREKLPRNGKPYIALANHQSFWENFFMQLIIPNPSFVVKQELLDIPIFGRCLKAARPVVVDRKNSRSVLQILQEGEKKIDGGLSVVMFPESTRVKVDKNVAFKVSAAKLALNTKVPIILIAHNAGLIWRKGFWFERKGTIKVKIIEIVSPDFAEKLNARELNSYIQERITTEKNKLVKLGV